MRLQLTEPSDKTIDAELDRLTYSAYLLTRDAALAMSVVMAALDDSIDSVSADASLLGRTVGLSLQQLRQEPNTVDRESSAAEVLLYVGYKVTGSNRILRTNEGVAEGSNPILALRSGSRIAFVLHHILGYGIREAAGMAHMTEQEYRAHLRSAYLELAFPNPGSAALPETAVAQSART